MENVTERVVTVAYEDGRIEAHRVPEGDEDRELELEERAFTDPDVVWTRSVEAE